MNYETATKTIENFDLSAYEERVLKKMLSHTSSEEVERMIKDQLTNDFEHSKDTKAAGYLPEYHGLSGYICNAAYEWVNCGFSKRAVIAFAKALVKAASEVAAEVAAEMESEVNENPSEIFYHVCNDYSLEKHESKPELRGYTPLTRTYEGQAVTLWIHKENKELHYLSSIEAVTFKYCHAHQWEN